MAEVICLGPSPIGFKDEVFSSIAPTIEKSLEEAGESYQQFLELYHGVNKKNTQTKEKQIEEEVKEDAEEDEKYGHKKKIFQAFEDYYGILGLQNKRWMATQDDIKKAYRKMVLEHHPDKNAQRGEVEGDAMFKSIQKAWETLCDPLKRKIYDSQEPFDDSIPSADSIKVDEDFYSIFGEAFKRFSKWSEKKQIPQLGDKNTPIDTVLDFYSFWRSFKSWRLYDFLDEYDTKEAESREERRWMERKNLKSRKKRKADELSRIQKLVELAFSVDPRVIKHKEEEKAEKERKQKEREEAAKKKKEEEARRAAEAQKKKEEDERKRAEELAQQKREKAKRTKKLKALRAKLRKLGQQNNFNQDKVEALCIVLSLEQLSALLSDEKPESLKQAFENECNRIEEEKKKKEEAEEQATKEQDDNKEDASWTPEELGLLAKAIIKFPGGVSARWQQIHSFLGGTKSIKEIVKKVAKLKTAGKVV
eukprot:TRINITY_DN5170_c0_g2_i5.p1 TRINITY_DN5170_c0_g2~~TRINITY_DN5170_c0_g2_i5.p1  ORF type:complete len:489 (-),score=142.65 TRINITY_DN5170_c0_g2_i5:40-1470(-)